MNQPHHPFKHSRLLGLAIALSPGALHAQIDIQDYDLTLAINQDLTMVGAGDITVKATEATSTFTLDFIGFDISNATWNGEPVTVNRVFETIEITLPSPLPAGETGIFGLTWSGTPQPYITEQGDLGVLSDRSITYAINVTDGASHWFPCVNQLSDKATVTLRLDVPRNSVSAGPGTLLGVEALTPQKERHTWRSDDAITPYLISFAFSDRYVLESFPITTSAGDVEANITLLPGTFDTASHALEQIPEMVSWLVSRYGAFPFPSVGMHEVPFPGAVEQPGYVAMGSFYWTGDPRLDVYFAHELSHSWFQGAMTIRTWDDVWLSEGIAAWHELLWIEESQEVSAADAQAAVYIDAYRVGQASEGIFPLSAPEEVFGYTTYMKGSTVWRLLEHIAGREALRGVLLDYLQGADGVGDLDLFFAHLESLGDPDLRAFREEWLDRAGLPGYRFGWDTAPSGEAQGVVIQVSQGNGALYTNPIDAHLSFADGTEEILTMRPSSADHVVLKCYEEAPVSITLDPRRMVPRSPDEAVPRLLGDAAQGCLDEPPTGCEAEAHLWPFLPALLLLPLLPSRRRREG